MSFIQNGSSDPVLEYYSLDDFALFDHEAAFWELCDALDFQPSSSEHSGDDDSLAGNKRKRSAEDHDARLPSTYEKPHIVNTVPQYPINNSQPTPLQQPAMHSNDIKTVTPTWSSSSSSSAKTIVPPQSNYIPNHYAQNEQPQSVAPVDDPRAALVHEINPFVAIPANDIRRQFAIMFAEAIGSNDGEQLGKILQEHCTEDVVLIFKYKGKTSPYGPTYLEVIGKHAVVVFWPQGIATVPDMVFELHSTNIKVLSNGYCNITTKCKLTGTKVLELAVDNKDSVVLVSDPNQAEHSSGKSAKASNQQGDGVLVIAIESEANPQVIPNQIPEDTVLKQLYKKGIKMNMITTITYYVDPNKQIYRIEFIHCMQQEKVNIGVGCK